MVTREREHAFSRASVLKTHLRCHQMVQIQEAHLPPHLELLPQLQVHVVHLGDGNVVVLPLLLAQQLVPATLKTDVFILLYEQQEGQLSVLAGELALKANVKCGFLTIHSEAL